MWHEIIEEPSASCGENNMFKEACQLLLSSLSSGKSLNIPPRDSIATCRLTHLKFTPKIRFFQVLQYQLAIYHHLIPPAAHDTL
jgi:hypothetical protein